MSTDSPKFTLLERILAYVASAIIVIAVLSYIATLVVGLIAGREVLAQGLWQFVTAVSFYGVPAGLIILMTLLGITFSRRSRASRGANERGAADSGRSSRAERRSGTAR